MRSESPFTTLASSTKVTGQYPSNALSKATISAALYYLNLIGMPFADEKMTLLINLFGFPINMSLSSTPLK
jgi:hypothetical protein